MKYFPIQSSHCEHYSLTGSDRKCTSINFIKLLFHNTLTLYRSKMCLEALSTWGCLWEFVTIAPLPKVP